MHKSISYHPFVGMGQESQNSTPAHVPPTDTPARALAVAHLGLLGIHYAEIVELTDRGFTVFTDSPANNVEYINRYSALYRAYPGTAALAGQPGTFLLVRIGGIYDE